MGSEIPCGSSLPEMASASHRFDDSFNCSDDLSSIPAAWREPGHSAQVQICRLKILQREGEFSCKQRCSMAFVVKDGFTNRLAREFMKISSSVSMITPGLTKSSALG